MNFTNFLKVNKYVVLFLILFLFSISFAKDDMNSKQKELKAIYNRIEKQKEALNKTKVKERNVAKEIKELDKKIKKSKENFNYSKYLVQKKTLELKEINKDMIKSKNSLARLYNEYYVRVRQIYKSGQYSWVEKLIEEEDFSVIANDIFAFEKLLKQDIMLIDKIKSEQKKINDSLVQVLNKKKVIEGRTNVILKEKNNLESSHQKKAKLQKILEKQRKQYEKEIAELEKNSRQIEQYIAKLKSKLKGNGSGKYMWPVKGWISSEYGYRIHPIFKTRKFHSGIDIAAPRGRSIVAADSGVVIYSGRFGGYGKTIIIDHGKNQTTVYGHQSRLLVKKGEKVQKGQVVGLVGSTGYSTGPHLHFEIRVGGKVVNPKKYLPK